MTAGNESTCVIAGGGPAGMMLGLLLARAGVDVTVMEKHADFLRDFRGDTVHASTLRLLDELGLGPRFDELPHRLIDSVRFRVEGVEVDVDFGKLPGAHKNIALVPQWDLLEMLATAADAEPSFRLLRNTEVVGAIRDGDRVVGVTYRDADGQTRDMKAALTVACDGRSSTLREAAGLVPRAFGAPMDVWWFRLPRHDGDPPGLAGVLNAGRAAITIDRGDYYQIAYIIPKGSDAQRRAAGIRALRSNLASMVPSLADRVDRLTSFDDVKLLDVQLNRLSRWYCDGLLCIGDAAHAMSPVGGVGINLAVADAVAAARILARHLRAGRVSPRHLAHVQVRRWIPTVILQAIQRTIHANLIAIAVGDGDQTPHPPAALKVVKNVPLLRRLAGYLVAMGPLPEHAPKYARR
ncbi:FAD-dependent oxidoreductase [Mycobacterium cookii]|uniref:Putative monooxygenase, FAD-binding protein n=1 Tax=Mycobacterium cookii TaxID=1775 RepID=A0A7I7KTK9_9MYCO|nr:FAD-dependent oxidoreductase [Mycobacterium cookii]MCV7328807.1 FAD-dependent oxidoreductase [Mycobacterium cookii]BBX45435.1 putative monooxygenase, FAD-binding protein [Mycobacterium cookii]